jgi:hypothetical protein
LVKIEAREPIEIRGVKVSCRSQPAEPHACLGDSLKIKRNQVTATASVLGFYIVSIWKFVLTDQIVLPRGLSERF